MDLVAEWETYQRVAGLSDATIRTRTRTLRRLQREQGPLPALDRAALITWLSQYPHAGTRSSFLSYIRCFYRWALNEEHLSHDPTRRLPPIKTPRRHARPVSTETLRAALNAAAPTRTAMDRADGVGRVTGQ